MRKFTDFIINKRHIILIVFIILSIISVILSSKVNINYDIAEYLPSTSETRIGMDIMEREFKEIKSSSLNLMFEDLEEEEKLKIYNELTSIDGVSSVDYDDTEDYNKDNYTLYAINVDDAEDSEIASNVYEEIKEKYKDYTTYTDGDIAERNEPVLPMWIMVLAIACAMVILIIMCDSYVEPFLFLATLLMAVLLNNGTNIIFGTVSNITSSISAILQMALSMDYSIMLMNRYAQEKQNEPDKVKAMKNALYNAFKSISSSSVTTIVGLLALVFMSFTIGRDLGLVLAKGVLFSLICIFFVLPSLILMFDKAITKTKKKSPKFKMDGLAKVSYKLRHVASILFIIAFAGSYILKGNLGISYTDTTSSKISEVFSENNQMALIYNSKDEETVAKYLSEIEAQDDVEEVLGYSNTINESLTYDKLNDKLNDLGADTEVEDYLLKIIYYNYYNQDENNAISYNDFVKFVQEDVYNNPDIADKIDEETKSNIDRLSNFTDSTSINKKRTASEIASILEINESDVKDLLIYYNSKNNNNVKISINEFINFMNKDVLTNPKYASSINNSTRESLNTLSKFTNANTIQTKMTSSQMAELFGMSETTMNDLYTYYISVNEIDTKLTISEFANFVLTDVLSNSDYASSFGEETINNIKMLAMADNEEITTNSMTAQELSQFIGIDEATVKSIYTLYTAKNVTTKLTPQEFVNFVLAHQSDAMLANSLDSATINELKLLQTVMDGVINNKKYSSTELGNLLGINTSDLNLLYSLYSSKYINTNQTISLKEFVSFILNDVVKNPEYSSNFDAETKSSLNTINGIMNASLNGTKYTKNEIFATLSNLADNLDKDQIDLLYVYYGSSKEYNDNWTLTVEQFINYLNDDILQDSRFDDFIEGDMRQSIIDAKDPINEAKDLLIGNNYSRVVINTKLAPETDDTFAFIQKIKDELGNNLDEFYLIGDSPMAYEMSQTFQDELNYITILTMIAIFIVVAITFKSLIIPLILVLMIQCAVYLTMGILSFTGDKVYFISILIVQSILMGATIDYAILYTSYYLEHRKTMSVKDSVINSYNKSINTILTSASILIIVTLIVGNFASAVAARICTTISQGTLCSAILILVLLPAVLASCDKIITRKKTVTK